MAVTRKKRDLPAKSCSACGVRFAWRRKWRECWEDVKFCSARCRRAARKKGGTVEDALPHLR
ncbi:DUF2256 domain-containing protein [bacterium]|nr:DUF2256 domain-containing protein [bacterium]